MAIKFTQVVDVANQRIINVGAPTGDGDAANKAYVDATAMGLDWKRSVRAASTADVDLASPGAELDGVTLAAGDRILLLHQDDATENGIYDYVDATTALTRSEDADGDLVSAGMSVSVEEGDTHGDRSFILVSDDDIVVGTSELIFTLINAGTAPEYTAGDGVDITGYEVTAVADPDGGLVVTPAGVAVDTDVVVRKASFDVGDGTATEIALPHGLGTLDVTVEVFTNAAPYDTVYAEVQRTDADTVTLIFGEAPAAAAYRAVVHG